KSTLRFFRWPIDLPVYALGIWVVFLVGRGFYRETYVGLDFLMNAALLLGAYLFLVRLAVRRALGIGSRRLLGRVIEGSRAGVGAHGAEILAGVESAVARVVGALERLQGLESSWRRALSD